MKSIMIDLFIVFYGNHLYKMQLVLRFSVSNLTV